MIEKTTKQLDRKTSKYIVTGSFIWIILWITIIMMFHIDRYVATYITQSHQNDLGGYWNDIVTTLPIIIASFTMSWGISINFTQKYKWLLVPTTIIGGVLISFISSVLFGYLYFIFNYKW